MCAVPWLLCLLNAPDMHTLPSLNTPPESMRSQTKILEEAHVGPEDFATMRLLGRGGFGTVYACRKIDSGKLYAMKAINKKLIKWKKAGVCIVLEGLVSLGVAESIGADIPVCCCSRHDHVGATHIVPRPVSIRVQSILRFPRQVSSVPHVSMMMLSYSCPFLCGPRLREACDVSMDLMAGGDLKFHLTKARNTTPHGGFPEARARFHAAEILLGMWRCLPLHGSLWIDGAACSVHRP